MTTTQSQLNRLMRFIDDSPTPYHAVRNAQKRLVEKGFEAISEADAWAMKPGGKYYVTRRDSSLLAFQYGTESLPQAGLKIIGAHTDSPTLKVKPKPEKVAYSYGQLGIEVYGGALLNPWFDRDLSLAGKVTVRQQGSLSDRLVDLKRPIATIPSLAIHLDRNVNQGRAINPQEHMRPILLQSAGDNFDLRGLLSDALAEEGESIAREDILDFDLSFYDTQKGSLVGVNHEFLASARLDNLLSCFAGLEAMVRADASQSVVLALFDHEEVGSQSDVGADGNFLMAFIERLVPEVEQRHRLLACSSLFSVDNAHGIHPNFSGKHDENHGPILNRGPVIKVDANQSYATSSATAGLVRLLAQEAGVEVQSYVTRADMRCGSTIGPMSAAKTGIQTVDLGLPTFAMHSIRELAGANDLGDLCAILEAYLKTRIASQ